MVVNFVDRNNEQRIGHIVREYRAFEGDWRYIIVDETTNREYRCSKINGQYKEYIV